MKKVTALKRKLILNKKTILILSNRQMRFFGGDGPSEGTCVKTTCTCEPPRETEEPQASCNTNCASRAPQLCSEPACKSVFPC
jgi:hypothetical protein